MGSFGQIDTVPPQPKDWRAGGHGREATTLIGFFDARVRREQRADPQGGQCSSQQFCYKYSYKIELDFCIKTLKNQS
jgi:hypothetical protein